MDQENRYGLKQIQTAELLLLHEFVKLCDQNKWRYCVVGGTFLGCIRHGGFIPWDDDIDVAMPRKDFQKMIEVLKKKESSKYKLITHENTLSYFNYVPKFVDTSIELKFHSTLNEQKGYPWIDIFPIDGLPSGKIFRYLYYHYVLFLRMKVNYSCFSQSVDLNKKNRPIHEKILIYLGKHLPVENIFKFDYEIKQLDTAMKRFDFDSSDYAVNYLGAYKSKEIVKKNIFTELEKYLFEDIEVYAPKEYDNYLKQIYGEYMKFPVDADRNHHGLCS